MPSRRPAVLAALLVVSVAAAAGTSACARRAPNASLAALRRPHPDLGAAGEQGTACAACHAGVTPAIVQDWNAGPHGRSLVKCFVCHGSTGSDFVASPGPQRCDACHPVQVASVTPSNRHTLLCFECHAPHRLDAPGKPNPHRAMNRP